jgi:hypothetical protein
MHVGACEHLAILQGHVQAAAVGLEAFEGLAQVAHLPVAGILQHVAQAATLLVFEGLVLLQQGRQRRRRAQLLPRGIVTPARGHGRACGAWVGWVPATTQQHAKQAQRQLARRLHHASLQQRLAQHGSQGPQGSHVSPRPRQARALLRLLEQGVAGRLVQGQRRGVVVEGRGQTASCNTYTAKCHTQ